jgi:hypothetical protein
MFEMLKNSESAKIQQLVDLLQKLDPRTEVVVQKKRNYTWLIVVLSIVAAAGVAFAVYKFFFEYSDEFDEFDDEDFEDIDYDEDFDDETDDEE